MTPFETSSQPLIHLMVDALARGPQFTPARSGLRTEAIVHGIMAFLPFEPVQTMLASQAVALHLAFLDMARDLSSGALPEAQALRSRSVMNAQTRTMLAVMRELRVVRREMLAEVQIEQAAQPAQAADRSGPPVPNETVPAETPPPEPAMADAAKEKPPVIRRAAEPPGPDALVLARDVWADDTAGLTVPREQEKLVRTAPARAGDHGPPDAPNEVAPDGAAPPDADPAVPSGGETYVSGRILSGSPQPVSCLAPGR